MLLPPWGPPSPLENRFFRCGPAPSFPFFIFTFLRFPFSLLISSFHYLYFSPLFQTFPWIYHPSLPPPISILSLHPILIHHLILICMSSCHVIVSCHHVISYPVPPPSPPFLSQYVQHFPPPVLPPLSLPLLHSFYYSIWIIYM